MSLHSGSKEIAPTVNGMRVFGICKGQIQRAVVKFKEPPEQQPRMVCFHFPSNFLTHRYVLDRALPASAAGMRMERRRDHSYVLDMVRQQLNEIKDARVQTIQFIDRNILHGTQVGDSWTY